jgi:hypothetical protein
VKKGEHGVMRLVSILKKTWVSKFTYILDIKCDILLELK